jgi:hypothetical protein
VAALVGVAAGLAVAAVALPLLADGRIAPVSLLAIPCAAALAWFTLRALAAGQPARAGLIAVILAAPLNWVVLEGVLPQSGRLGQLLSSNQPPERLSPILPTRADRLAKWQGRSLGSRGSRAWDSNSGPKAFT